MATTKTKAKAKPDIDNKLFVFTADVIDDILEKQNLGYLLRRHENPWWKNQTGVRRAGIVWGWTDEEMDEYTRCKLDVHYFAETYCKIKLEDGSVNNLKLRDYQKDIIDLYTNNRFSMLMASRQTGKTISAAITILHYITFNNDKGVMIVANKANTVIEIMDKIKNIYKNLPFFLKVGIINWNNRSMALENGCRIKTEARTKEPSIGFTVDFLYLDEFAYVPNSIAEKFYKSVVPTVSSIDNSKIVITSTPNGFNLFYKLWHGANLPKGDPNKNPYKPLLVYWWQVPGRRDTKLYLDYDALHRNKITQDDLKEHFNNLGAETYIKREQKDDGTLQEVFVVKHVDEVCDIDAVRATRINDRSLAQLANITNWEEQETLLVGGKESFDQEYNLHFMAGSKRLFTSDAFKRIEANKVEFVFQEIEKLTRSLNFEYKELRFTPNEELFKLERATDYQIVMSVDLSEGLGQDYSVINIFRLIPKDISTLEKRKLKTINEAFRLEQIGVYSYNKISLRELSTLLYLIAFEVFDPDKVKIVLEVNKYGGEVQAELPHVLDDNNEYGSYIFARYKHRIDSEKTSVGLKVSTNKNLFVKEYVDRLTWGDIGVSEWDTLSEMTNFIKHETRAGNVQYKAEVGHDDRVMTVVNLSTFFNTQEYKNMVLTAWENTSYEFRKAVNDIMNEKEYSEAPDYDTMRNARKIALGRRRMPGEVRHDLQGRWIRKKN